MFILASLLGLALSVNQPGNSTVTIQILDETDVVSSAHVCVNDSVAGISDFYGKVILHDITIGDKVTVTHLAYQTESFSIQSLNDTTITLLSKKYSIQEARYSKDFDYDILRSKLKPGLSGGTYPGIVPVISRDTLVFKENRCCINEKANVSFLLKYYEPVLTGYRMKIVEKDNSTEDSISVAEIKKLKHRLKEVFSNVQFLTECACKCRKYKGFRVEYRGTVDSFEVFYFFMPPQDLNIYKCRGYLYIDSATGILDHIEATCTSLSESYLSYDLLTYYQYFDSGNSILPKTITDIIYYYDKGGALSQTQKRQVSLDWDNASK